MTQPRLLLVEDDRALADLLMWHFGRAGYDVVRTGDGDEALLLAEERTPDLVVLDWMIEGVSGIEVCRRLRRKASTGHVPIIMLTARGEESDRVRGLDTGADDYLVKPFDLDELAARVRALLRRRTGQKQPVYTHGELALDPAAHEVTKNGVPIALVPREFALLHALIEAPTRVHTKPELEEKLYGWGAEVGSNAVEVHVHSLRRKIGAEQVVTVRGVGYRLKRIA